MVFQMYRVATAVLVLAVAAALFGFGIVSDDTPLVAKLGVVFVLLVAVAVFDWTWMRGSRAVPARRRDDQ